MKWYQISSFRPSAENMWNKNLKKISLIAWFASKRHTKFPNVCSYIILGCPNIYINLKSHVVFYAKSDERMWRRHFMLSFISTTNKRGYGFQRSKFFINKIAHHNNTFSVLSGKITIIVCWKFWTLFITTLTECNWRVLV